MLDVNEFWKDRRVLITGHTGFKGAWLTLWLKLAGADILGVSLEPEKQPGLLDQFELTPQVRHEIQDIRDADAVRRLVTEFCPQAVFHLAAQPLVRRSYREPIDTWSTNVSGTINVLEALRPLESPVAAVMVTTDKVYLNREWHHAYREADRIGGHDPYSSSKAAAELAVESWRSSFFGDHAQIAVATARAGNVVGGGDDAEDRIVPDVIRSLENGTPAVIRNPGATRPWQHVLEPLSGYLTLARQMQEAQSTGDAESLQQLASAWNFGPHPESNQSVGRLVDVMHQHWPGTWTTDAESPAVHEATYLALAIDKAARYLNWHPCWSFHQTVAATVDWYRRCLLNGESARAVATQQIEEFLQSRSDSASLSRSSEAEGTQ